MKKVPAKEPEPEPKLLFQLRKVKKDTADGQNSSLEKSDSSSSIGAAGGGLGKGAKTEKEQGSPMVKLKKVLKNEDAVLKSGSLEKSDSSASIQSDADPRSRRRNEEPEPKLMTQLKKVQKKEPEKDPVEVKKKEGTSSGIDTSQFKLEKRERTKLEKFEKTALELPSRKNSAAPAAEVRVFHVGMLPLLCASIPLFPYL